MPCSDVYLYFKSVFVLVSSCSGSSTFITSLFCKASSLLEYSSLTSTKLQRLVHLIRPIISDSKYKSSTVRSHKTVEPVTVVLANATVRVLPGKAADYNPVLEKLNEKIM